MQCDHAFGRKEKTKTMRTDDGAMCGMWARPRKETLIVGSGFVFFVAQVIFDDRVKGIVEKEK